MTKKNIQTNLAGMVQEITLSPEALSKKKTTQNSYESSGVNGGLSEAKIQDDDHDNGYETSCMQKLLYAIGILCGTLMGVLQPFILVLYGEYLSSLVSRFTPEILPEHPIFLPIFGGGHYKPNVTYEETLELMLDDSRSFAIGGTLLSLLQFITGALSVLLLNYVAQKKISAKRIQFLKALLKQEISWHDVENSASSVSSSLTEIEKLKDGIGEKVGMFLSLLGSFVVSVVMAFFHGWKLTLVIASLSPVLIISVALVAKVQNSLALKAVTSYAKAGAVAEEVLGSIRTVAAFGGEEKEVERYKTELLETKKTAIWNGVFSGLGMGATWLLIFGNYALAFWYGTPLIINDRFKEHKEYTPGVLTIVLFGVTIGAMNIGNTSPYIEAFSKAKAAAKKLTEVTGRKTKINPFSTSGKRIKGPVGTIEFRDVYFNYPSRSNVKVLQGLNLKINQGETVALVGSSGCGKSTTIQLLERFYDPDSGSVLINGVNLKDLELRWLRQQIGLVGQEPVLFNMTVAENICGDLNVSHEEMIEAAKNANAHDFIKALPKGYDTIIGEGNSRFSGGQKQRIAIARALIRKPSILLLDEATSALDVANEVIVQSALNRISKGRTTLIVSHRLSAIQNVDRIVVIKDGQVAEQGKHAELMEKKSLYYDLVSADAALQKKVDGDNKEIAERPEEDLKLDDKQEPESSDSQPELNDTKVKPTSWIKMLKLNGPEWYFIVIGSIGSFVMGLASPLSSVIYGYYISGLANANDEEVIRSANWISLAYLFIAVIVFINVFIEFSVLGIAGARLTNRLRLQVFGSIVKQDQTWFDSDKNGVGVLATRLSSDTNNVQGATGSKLGTIMQCVSSLGIGVGLAMFYSWKMTLASLISIPIILGSLLVESVKTSQANQKETHALEQAAKVAVESVANIRTVASLGWEQLIMKRYSARLDEAEAAFVLKSKLRSFTYAISQASLNMTYALSIWYGGYLIKEDGIPFRNTIIVAESIVFGAYMVGQIMAFIPDISTARYAATRLFDIIERKPQIYQPTGDTGPLKNSGNIQYSDLYFAYPKRPNAPVLSGLNLKINEGQKIALVGLSGCGKSTCIQLLQRFYDAQSGTLSVDDKEITSLSLHRLRNEQSIVSQEPVLFNCTIAENIAYGDNSRTVSMDEIINVAKKANIHEFVTSLPAGYETKLGARGFQLSGGQKQRIAIARALIRNPRLLILDEATSALDTQSEKVVQAALEEAMEGRTCIMIAHRLSTVTRCNVIYVLEKGVVVEQGTHDELVARNQYYSQLLQQQHH